MSYQTILTNLSLSSLTSLDLFSNASAKEPDLIKSYHDSPESVPEEGLAQGASFVQDTLYAQYIEGRVRVEESKENDFLSILKSGTNEIHKLAIKNTFLQKLLKGSFCPTQFVKYLLNLHAIHMQLEKVQLILNQSIYQCFVFESLWKSCSIEMDIQAWKMLAHGVSLEKDCIASATKAYVNHLDQILKQDMVLIIPHLWVFYGTLLSGGQMIGKSVSCAYNEKVEGKHCQEQEGTKFFSLPFDVAQFKNTTWHPALNEIYDKMPITEKERMKSLCLHEAHLAFRVVIDFIEEAVVNDC